MLPNGTAFVAMLGVLSLAIYYANLFLPVGRVLCMLWIVVAGVRLRLAVRSA